MAEGGRRERRHVQATAGREREGCAHSIAPYAFCEGVTHEQMEDWTTRAGVLLRLVLLAVNDVCYEEFKKATIVLQTLQGCTPSLLISELS